MIKVFVFLSFWFFFSDCGNMVLRKKEQDYRYKKINDKDSEKGLVCQYEAILLVSEDYLADKKSLSSCPKKNVGQLSNMKEFS